MISTKWNKSIDEILDLCIKSGLPVEVEKDTKSQGIDGVFSFGAIPIEPEGNVGSANFEMILRYSTPKKNWRNLLEKMEILTQNLGYSNRFVFLGWTPEDDDSNMVYFGTIFFKSIISNP